MTSLSRGPLAWLAILLCGGQAIQAAPEDQDVFLKLRTGSTAGVIAQTNDHHMIYGLAVGTSLPTRWGTVSYTHLTLPTKRIV